jgi:hypothetical protein
LPSCPTTIVKLIEQIDTIVACGPTAAARDVNPALDQMIMNDNIFIDTILEVQAILAREHASAEETIAKLMQLLDSTELVKPLAKRDFRARRSNENRKNGMGGDGQRRSLQATYRTCGVKQITTNPR